MNQNSDTQKKICKKKPNQSNGFVTVKLTTQDLDISSISNIQQRNLKEILKGQVQAYMFEHYNIDPININITIESGSTIVNVNIFNRNNIDLSELNSGTIDLSELNGGTFNQIFQLIHVKYDYI